jgi:hypothetical protein
MTIARTSIIQSGLPKKFWPEAVAHAVFTKNRIPHRALSEHLSPIEVLKPDSNITNERLRFRSFGEPIWIHNPAVSLSHNKLSPRSEKGRIVSYSTGYKTYRACTERGSIVLTKDPKPRIIAQASPSIHISVPASEQCPDILKTIPTPISTETDKSKPDSISDHQPLNTDTKGHITAKPSSISSVPGGFPNDNTHPITIH